MENSGQVRPGSLTADLQRSVFSANYGGGSWTVISLEEDGRLGEVRQHEEFSAECEVSHPHQTVVRGDSVWVVDLGCDSVWQYRHQARVLHLDVEERSEELQAPALLCHKEPARAYKAPY